MSQTVRIDCHSFFSRVRISVRSFTGIDTFLNMVLIFFYYNLPGLFSVNLLVIESLESYDKFFEDRLLVDFPTVRGRPMRLRDVSIQLCTRLVDLFLPDEHGHRPCHGTYPVSSLIVSVLPNQTFVNYHAVVFCVSYLLYSTN